MAPNGSFLYRTTKPYEAVMGLFVSDLAFFNAETKQLVYCTPINRSAMELMHLKSHLFINFQWFNGGNWVWFVTYRANDIHVIIVDLINSVSFDKKVGRGDDLYYYENIHGYVIDPKLEEKLMREGFVREAISENYIRQNYRPDRWYGRLWYPRSTVL